MIVKRNNISNFIKNHQSDDDKDAILIDGHESAFIGYVRTEEGLSAAYSYSKIIDKLTEDSMSYEEAVKFYDYNIERGIMYLFDGVKPTIVHMYGLDF
jgi:hypothetical protein